MELDDEQRRQIEAEAMAMVATDLWRTISRVMRSLEGEGWAGDGDAALSQVVDGPMDGRLLWRLEDGRQFIVEEVVVETTVVDGRPTRRRVIGDEGVLVDQEVVDPSLN